MSYENAHHRNGVASVGEAPGGTDLNLCNPKLRARRRSHPLVCRGEWIWSVHVDHGFKEYETIPRVNVATVIKL